VSGDEQSVTNSGRLNCSMQRQKIIIIYVAKVRQIFARGRRRSWFIDSVSSALWLAISAKDTCLTTFPH